jgi:glycosyltransferase involved in cell wall biosynthesis
MVVWADRAPYLARPARSSSCIWTGDFLREWACHAQCAVYYSRVLEIGCWQAFDPGLRPGCDSPDGFDDPMNIVWLAPEPPIPPLTGGRERSRRMLEYLARRHAVHLVTFAAQEEKSGLDDLRHELADLTAIAYPSGWEYWSSQMCQAVGDAISSWPDLVHIQGLDMYRYMPSGSNIRCVLDLHDVPGLLEARLMRLEPTFPASIWRAMKLAHVYCCEITAIRRANAVIVVSEQDRMALASAYADQAHKLVVIPNGQDLGYWTWSGADPDPATVMFPGALNWLPNIDAARVLIQSVLPYVRASVPQVQVIIAGCQPDPALHALVQSCPSVTLIADPSDMRPLFARATVVAVPLRAATGTRHKILQAMAMGRPVVSTCMGAEGLGLVAGVDLLVAPVVEPFGDALAYLLTHPARRVELVQAGQAAIHRYAWENYLPRLDTLYGNMP